MGDGERDGLVEEIVSKVKLGEMVKLAKGGEGDGAREIKVLEIQ